MKTLLDQPGAVEDAAREMASAERVALDVEGDGLFRYRARLCTVQLATRERIAVVDTLEIQPQLLAPLVEEGGPEKVIHDASFDVRLLRDVGLRFHGLFDTSVAARYLGRARRLWPGDNPAFEQAQGDRDMLQELIELAHAEGMAVIPWFEFGFMAPGDYALHAEHPEWFTQRRDGSQAIPMGNEVFTWMNPFHPQTRQLLLQLMAEVLENYEVEGIQVDDHLGLPVDMGYDPYTVALYQQEHGGASPPADETDADWMRWRADKISEFMRDVRRVIDRRQPGALLSVSPNPYPFSYAKYLQDWPTWEAAGLLDEVIVQIYRGDLERFVWELNKPATAAARRRTPTSIGLLSGLKNRPTDVDLLTEQLAAVRDRGYAGVSYFFYQSLWAPGNETMAERDQQFRSSFSQAATRP